MKHVKSQDIRIIMEDLSFEVGCERAEKTVATQRRKGDLKGDRLMEWCEDDNLKIMNPWLKGHPRRCWTWKSPRDRSRD